MELQNLVAEGDNVILKKGRILKVYKVLKKEKVFLEKRHFSLGPIIGHPYGSTWELRGTSLVQVLDKTQSHDIAGQIETGGVDNRGIFDDDSSQRLDKDDIQNLKQEGKSGQEIIDHLIENSSTFHERTVYSKAKYLKKKRNKHILQFVVLRPCTRLVCEMYFNRAPSKHVQLRVDTLSQLLTASNVQSGSKVMVMEHCQGLLVGAIMERLGGNGTVVHFHTEEGPMQAALQAFNFSKDSKDNVLRTFKVKDVYDRLIMKKPVETETCESVNLNMSKTGDDEKKSDGCDLKSEAIITMEAGCSRDNGQDVMTTESNEGLSSSNVEKENGNDKEKAEDGVVGYNFGLPMVTDDDDGDDKKQGLPQTSDAMDENIQEIRSEEDVGPTDNAQKRKLKFLQFIESDVEKRREKKRQKLDKMAKTTEMLLEKNMDTLLIATKMHPAPVLLALIDFLGLSRPFVVFSPYKEPLVECYVKLRDRGGVINLNVTETWHREYQVLPDRTHPMIMMNHAGGYILSGLHVGK